MVGALGVNQNIATPADASDSAASTVASLPSAAPSQVPPAPPAFITAPPCGSYYGAKTTTVTPPFGHGYPGTVPDQVCGYKPGQFRSAYNVGSANTGKGVTVAVIDAYDSATIASDATQYFRMNDPGNPFANAHFSQLDSTPFDDEAECDASGWLTEQAIDVESVHSMAPDANILYVGAKDCTRRPVQRRAERHRQRAGQRGHQLVGRRLPEISSTTWPPGPRSTTCSCWPTRPG